VRHTPLTPPARLALFPRPLKNPDGTRPIGPGAHIQRAMRAWAEALPHRDGPERDAAGRSIPFPRDPAGAYAFRHSFANATPIQGTPVDTLLRELLGHDTVRTTLGYYRSPPKETRRPGPPVFPPARRRRAPRAPGLTGLGHADALRDQVGQVAVRFGICTEPTNVGADGPARSGTDGSAANSSGPTRPTSTSCTLTSRLSAVRRLDSQTKAAHVRSRLDALVSPGEAITVSGLARAARVSQWFI